MEQIRSIITLHAPVIDGIVDLNVEDIWGVSG